VQYCEQTAIGAVGSSGTPIKLTSETNFALAGISGVGQQQGREEISGTFPIALLTQLGP
jgi:hypothetical protein